VPDVEYTPHENTFLRKRNHKWVTLKSDMGRRSRKMRRAGMKSLFTLDFHFGLGHFLALKGLTRVDIIEKNTIYVYG